MKAQKKTGKNAEQVERETRLGNWFADGKQYRLVKLNKWNENTLEINGVKMHQAIRQSPMQDALGKVKLLNAKKGNHALDVCTGLGYSAIYLAEAGCRVVTVEADPNVLKIAKMNDSSQALFTNKDIEIISGDALEVVASFPSDSFDIIQHDPPRFSFAGHLYSLEFYKHLYRVLKKSGKLFHYTGKPGEASGKSMLKGIKERLTLAGFKKIEWIELNQGFLMEK